MLLSFAQTMWTAWGKVWPILIAILCFGVIIMGHELGHFLTAKLFKVRVNEFALGMGPAIFKFVRGETKYALRLLPIGGFVQMEGEDEDSEDEKSFGKKAVWKRIIIVAAGAIINLIMGVLIVAIMLSQMDLVGTRTVNYFHENATSQQTGLEKGDTIIEIDGKHVFSMYDVSILMARNADGVFDFVVMRDGQKTTLSDVKFETKDVDGQNTIIWDFVFVGLEDAGFTTIAKDSFMTSFTLGRTVWLGLFDIVTGQYGISDLSGPIGVIDYVSSAAAEASQQADMSQLLMMIALITINIGLFNLLPIPGLDGGRLFFMLIELIFRKPIPQKYERWVHAAGLVLLLGLMLVITLSDILKLIRN